MKKLWLLFAGIASLSYHLKAQSDPVVSITDGTLQGVLENSVRVFRGIPYARPPIGALRWKDPQPVQPWKGTRQADRFGARCYQRAVYKDMVFRSEKENEDCLYLNVWTTATSTKANLPVLVYFHGGGLSSGEGAELRYDGSSMAQKGIVMVTVNYRLGVFGFMAHPALTKESPHRYSGNYGFLDQRAALLWVKKNIRAFGGDPNKVTIAGQSAGSISVSAHMASPLSKGLFRYAIGESGSILAALTPIPFREAEQNGAGFMAMTGAKDIAALRQIPAEQLHQLSVKDGVPYFSPTIDGYFLPGSPMDIFAKGLQADVPLLAGWTSAEVTYHRLMGKEALTADNYKKVLVSLYGDKAAQVLQFYPANTQEELQRSATDLASDRFIAYSTWKWLDLHGKTSGSTVYRYLFAQPLPPLSDNPQSNNGPSFGTPHSADIAYALGNLSIYNVYAWTAADVRVSERMQSYLVNFIKTGNPNGEGLPEWPGLQSSIPKVMVFDTDTKALPEKNLKRYVFLDQFYYK